MEIWLDELYGKIEYYPVKNYIKMTLLGNIEDDDYKHLWNLSLEKAFEIKCGNLLIDQRKIGFVRMKSRAWFILKWMPESNKLMKEVEQKLAVLPSAHLAHKLGLSYLLNAFAKIMGHHSEIFEHEEEAILWFTLPKQDTELES